MLFYDFEVYKEDWLVVIIDMSAKSEHVIINDAGQLLQFYQSHVNDIWVGFNNNHYDQWIFKGILCGFNPKEINDFIIQSDTPGWRFSSLLNKFQMINYDVMKGIDRGLKMFEGFMGNDIKESSVPFNINRKLTESELTETVKYCRHDVEQTIQVFIQRKSDFEAHMGLVKLACQGKGLDLSLLSRTEPQLSAIILEAVRQDHDDEFDIDFPSSMKIEKYTSVVEWYADPANRCYYTMNNREGYDKNQLEIMVAGVPHQFGWGGLHGAIDKYSGEGYYLNMDVASLYPSLMILYDLHSRNMKHPDKYEQIYKQRLQYKAEKNPLQAPLKLVLNSTYGVMKDKTNPLFDPRQANRVCVYGQLLLLDLIEKLEPHCQIIQSNTDGVLIKMNDYNDYELIDDIAWEWEQRTGLQLEFDEFCKVFQKDVNNYIMVDAAGHYKSKGAYLKELSSLDYDLPIVNQALVDYMVKGVPVADTIFNCDDLKEFQLVSKITNKYSCILHGSNQLKERCIRMFASVDKRDAGVKKVHSVTQRPAKLPNSPEHCFIYNDDVNGAKCPEKLDKHWYLSMANKRLIDFGVSLI